MTVVMTDATQESADKGKEKIAEILTKRVKRGRMTQDAMDAVLGRITATADYDRLEACDLIIEAVFEDRDLKAKVTGMAEAAMDPDGVFASNTSTLPITSLATASQRPEKFIGLHFFSPVDKMQLVEIIMGENTSDEALAKAFDYVLAINKVPIVVNDSRGFYTSRVFGTWVQEGAAMLGEGQHPQSIEMAGIQAGMPVGPLALLDEVSLKLVSHIDKQTRADLEAEGKPVPDNPAMPVINRMLELGRAGRADGAGFYEYNGGKHLWEELPDHFPLSDEQMTQEEMIDRLMFIQSIETVRCLEEGVLRSVPDANIGAIFGWGYAPFNGGTLQYINAYGVKAFVERAQALAEAYGERFAVPQMLKVMADKGETF
jgi:3-hydroxyacyl-CoA dehydrogenase/enoyl-CoA hydratase/3-hydroxybutyryl-CoA epimerase